MAITPLQPICASKVVCDHLRFLQKPRTARRRAVAGDAPWIDQPDAA
jgi:hypothetical protein